jgi:hypothetical protein
MIHFLALTPAGQGLDTNTMIMLSVFFICFAAVAIALINKK